MEEKRLCVVMTVTYNDWGYLEKFASGVKVVHVDCDRGFISKSVITANRVMIVTIVAGLDKHGKTKRLREILREYASYNPIVGLHGRFWNFTEQDLDMTCLPQGLTINSNECTTSVPCAYKSLLDELTKELPNSTYIQRHFDELFNNIKTGEEEILSSFFPLHLALQAFFGISKSENGKWVELSNVAPAEWGDAFPKKDAFLLVKEAQWDFYASIFNRIMREKFPRGIGDGYTANCAEETQEYMEGRTLAALLGNVANDAKLKQIYEAFNPPYGEENNNFVKCLRELCAILANTREDCKKDQCYYGYKGKEEAKKVRNGILAHLGINPEDSEEKHCKIENTPRNRYYQPLQKQIENWGIEKARRVIEGIEELAKLLEE